MPFAEAAFVPMTSQIHMHRVEAYPIRIEGRERGKQHIRNVVAPSRRSSAPLTTAPSYLTDLAPRRPQQAYPSLLAREDVHAHTHDNCNEWHHANAVAYHYLLILLLRRQRYGYYCYDDYDCYYYYYYYYN